MTSSPDRYYFGDEGRLLTCDEAESDADVAAVHSFFGSLKELSAEEEEETSVLELMRRRGASQRQLALAESIYSNDFGCSLSKLGLKESIQEAKCWVYGDSYLILNQHSLGSTLVPSLAEGLEVWCSWPVSAVEYSQGMSAQAPHDSTAHQDTRDICRCDSAAAAAPAGELQPAASQKHPPRVVLQGPGGRRLAARSAIITVPLRILQEEAITFRPPLPRWKRDAVDALRMSNAVKIFLTFSRQFWPTDLFDVVCTDSFLPEIWITSRQPAAVDKEETPKWHLGPVEEFLEQAGFVITGFAAGSRADHISSMDPCDIILASLAQLDRMFGTATEQCSPRNDGVDTPLLLCKSNSCGMDDQVSGPTGLNSPARSKGTSELSGSTGTRGSTGSITSKRRSAGSTGSKGSTGSTGSAFPSGVTGPILPKSGALPVCERSRPASAAFVGALVVDWSKEPFVRGAYTHPSLNAHGAREVLAAPLSGCLFFAGEATHHGVNPCIQAAMDSGTRAGVQAAQSLVPSSL